MHFSSISSFLCRVNRVGSTGQPCWRPIALAVLVGLLCTTPARAEEEPKEDPAEKESLLLGEVRQLTFEGRRAGEGYFSADGTKMIFQSERAEGNPFYQIYLLDLETGDTERISPGVGKTTCAWIHPDGDRALFASTHADPESEKLQEEEYEERASGEARKYSWDYDDAFEIYEYDLETEEYTNLTNTRGYDAEGAYSPDGSKIVFASNRQAYDGSLSEEDQKAFKLDKKFPMEIYTMDADGSNVKRLTNVDGYDGGPFFNADGTKICWRRFDRKGLTAEVYTMDADGSDERQLTQLGAMSWAPFFHPSGEYLIFTTNKHGFDNFELYLVDAAGEKEPVRVTYTPGFDGLPTFSPDGKQMSWTSKRTAADQSQIFLAQWDHEKALELLGAAPAASAPEKQTSSKSDPSTEKTPAGDYETEPGISEADMRKHIEYLASDALKGRLTGTDGEIIATAHVADFFEEWGLEPGGDGESYFQEFEFTAGVAVGEDNAAELTIDGEATQPEVDRDWRPVSFSQNGKIPETGIVFAGYGMEVPDGEGGESYSSYFHLDPEGKWVMVLRYAPQDVSREKRREMQRYARLRHKATMARRKSAKGIIFVTGPRTQVKEELVPMRFDASLADSGIPAISVTTEMAEKIVASAGKKLEDIQKTLDTGEMVQGFDVPGASLAATIDVDQEKSTGRNVIGVLSAGKGGPHPPPATVVGAHIDHLGAEAGPGSLATDGEADEIHYGADDNASGVAALMEIAEHMAHRKAEGELELERDVVFAGWSGEELGLLGSSHFVRTLAKEAMGDPDAPLNLLLSSYLNMDMVGRLEDKLIIQGVGSSNHWAGAIERRNVPVGLPITVQQDAYLPTDAINFYLREVPILSAFTGAHEDYHTPRDTADKINYEGATKIARFVGLLTRGLATDPQAPDYVKVDPPKNKGSRGFRVYLGTVPDYSQADIEGVKLSGVAENGPAAEAGVKGGDVVVGLAGKEVLNIYDYTDVLAGLKVGEETEIVVERDGEKLKLPITPGSRD